MTKTGRKNVSERLVMAIMGVVMGLLLIFTVHSLNNLSAEKTRRKKQRQT